MALIAGIVATPIVAGFAAYTIARHMFDTAPYDRHRFLCDPDSSSDDDSEDDSYDGYDGHDGYDGPCGPAAAGAAARAQFRGRRQAPGSAAAVRQTHALYTGPGQAAQAQPLPGTDLGRPCAPPATQPHWNRSVSKPARSARRSAMHLAAGGVGFSRRSRKQRASVRTHNFFKTQEFGGYVRDPQGNVYKTFHNRTDLAPDREYLPLNARRHQFVPKFRGGGALQAGVDPHTNAPQQPHEDITDMADVVQKRVRERARFEVENTTAGLTATGTGSSINQQAPVGFVGGYDTNLFDSQHINLGTTVSMDTANRSNMVDNHAELAFNRPGVQTINVQQNPARGPQAETDHAPDAARGANVAYETVGSLDNAQRTSTYETDYGSGWSTVTTVREQDPTHSALRLSPEYEVDTQPVSTTQTAVTKTNQLVGINRSNVAEPTALPSNNQGSTSQITLMRTASSAQPLENRTNIQDAETVHRSSMAINTLTKGSVVRGTNWQQPAETAADAWTDGQIVGVSRSDGDNLNWSSGTATDLALGSTLPTQLVGATRLPLQTQAVQFMDQAADVSSNLGSQRETFRYN
jgi:hypothetical protein